MKTDTKMSQLTVRDILELANFYFNRAEKHKLKYENGEVNNMNEYHSLTMKALDCQRYAELFVQTSIKSTMGDAPQLISDTFAALNPANLSKEVEKHKSYKKGEIPEAQIINDEKAESREINQNIVENARNLEIEILTKKAEKNEQESSLVKNLRTLMCKMIGNGERNELARLLSNYTFKYQDYDTRRAHQFINAVKQQFNVLEPESSLKGRPANKIPVNKFIYARYTREGPKEKETRTGYIKRHPKRTQEMTDEYGNFKCHLDDVEKWRYISPDEKPTQCPF